MSLINEYVGARVRRPRLTGSGQILRQADTIAPISLSCICAHL